MGIRKARIEDIPAIHRILTGFAKQGLLLPRSLSELYDHARDFFVLEEGGLASGERIKGVAGLGICWEDLAEIKSLAVSEDLQRRGLGSQLVETCLEDARRLGIKKVFALTYFPGFFVANGFRAIEKSLLPHKIWADCIKCPKFPDCDETAVMIELHG